MVIRGGRYESQLCAIEMNAGCIIIGLGAKVSRTIRKLASENQVSIIATPLTTYSCAKVVSQAVPVRHVMRRRGLITFEPDDVVEDVKRAVSKKRMRYYPLLDEQGRYIGMFSQRNLLDLERPSVILVDHNERDQAADGIRSLKSSTITALIRLKRAGRSISAISHSAVPRPLSQECIMSIMCRSNRKSRVCCVLRFCRIH